MYFKILTGLATVSLMIGCGSSDSSATLEYLEIKDNDIYITENRVVKHNIVYEYLEGENLTWTITGGADRDDFNLTGTELNSKAATVFDFENPQDDNLDNIYEVQVDVTDGTYSDTKNLRIHVVDEKIVSSDSAYEYETVTSDTGRIWLSKNLGAQYSKKTEGIFDTDKNVTDGADNYKAYGSLFQWGRKADGHEILNWTSNTNQDSASASTGTQADNPEHGEFITSTSNGDWRATSKDDLWSSVASANNPCPADFRLPTKTEWQTELNSWNSQDYTGAIGSALQLTKVGKRVDANGAGITGDTFGAYHSSTTFDSDHSYYLFFDGATASIKNDESKATGMSVRCIKD